MTHPQDLPMSTVDDALETVRIAAALGMSIPVPEGLTVYEVTLTYENGNEESIGLFSSYDAAQTALRNNIVDGMAYTWFNPEDNMFYSEEEITKEEWSAATERWLSTHTNEDLIRMWANANCGDILMNISPRIISPKPAPLMK